MAVAAVGVVYLIIRTVYTCTDLDLPDALAIIFVHLIYDRLIDCYLSLSLCNN